MPYDLQSIPSPRLTGLSLAAVAGMLDVGVTRAILEPMFLRDTGILRFRAMTFAEAPSVSPQLPRPSTLADAPGSQPPDLAALSATAAPSKGFRFESIGDFARA